MADFAEVASSGAAVKRDCDFHGKISGLLLHLDRDHRTHPYWHWQKFIPAGAGPALLISRKRHVPQLQMPQSQHSWYLTGVEEAWGIGVDKITQRTARKALVRFRTRLEPYNDVPQLMLWQLPSKQKPKPRNHPV